MKLCTACRVCTGWPTACKWFTSTPYVASLHGQIIRCDVTPSPFFVHLVLLGVALTRMPVCTSTRMTTIVPLCVHDTHVCFACNRRACRHTRGTRRVSCSSRAADVGGVNIIRSSRARWPVVRVGVRRHCAGGGVVSDTQLDGAQRKGHCEHGLQCQVRRVSWSCNADRSDEFIRSWALASTLALTRDTTRLHAVVCVLFIFFW
jgi:hypothetical protein